MAKKYFDNMPESDKVALNSSLGKNVIPPILNEHPNAINPVLNAASVTDRTAQGVADPFIIQKDGIFYMFFEVITATEEEIGYATSIDGLTWAYGGICLTEAGQHFAYPFVFKDGEDYYMIPDMGSKCNVYKATTFPTVWTLEKTLFNKAMIDATLFQFKGNWYLHAKESTGLTLYVTNDWLNGTWAEHPQSPISVNVKHRGAGRPIVHNNNVILPIQDYITTYGEFAKWFNITNLTPTTATLTEGNIAIERDLTFPAGYASRGRHHIDNIGDLFVTDAVNVDGTNNWSIAIFTRSKRKKICKVINIGSAQELTAINTWDILRIGETSGQIIIDNSYLWDRTNLHFDITKSGYYRIFIGVTFYVNAANELKFRVRNKVDNSILLEYATYVASDGTINKETLNTSQIFNLQSGMQLVVEILGSVITSVVPSTGFMILEEI